MSSLSYLIDIYPDHIPETFINETRNLIRDFIWKSKTWWISQKTLGLKKTDGGHLPTPPPIPAPLPAYLIHHGTSLCGPPPSPSPPGAMLEKKFCIASKTHRICNAQTRFPRISFFFLRDDTLDSHAENQRFQIIVENTSAVKFDGHLESPQKRTEMFLSSMRNIQEHLWCTLKEKRLNFIFYSADPVYSVRSASFLRVVSVLFCSWVWPGSGSTPSGSATQDAGSGSTPSWSATLDAGSGSTLAGSATLIRNAEYIPLSGSAMMLLYCRRKRTMTLFWSKRFYLNRCQHSSRLGFPDLAKSCNCYISILLILIFLCVNQFPTKSMGLRTILLFWNS